MDVYQVINQRIMELLEQNVVPWRKTWNGIEAIPKSLISKKAYRGINAFVLGCMPYDSSYWMTFKQCQEKGGRVRKGEKSSPVIFWKWLDRRDEEAADGEVSSNGKIPMLRFYQVFNLEQTEGITAPPSRETVKPFTAIELAEQIIAGMPLRPEIKHGGGRAYYSPTLGACRAL